MKNTVSVKKNQNIPWFEQLMVMVATLNYGLVLFDMSYTDLRDYYFNYIPVVTQVYDPIKGIEPHQITEKYLETIEQLKVTIAETSLYSPETDEILGKLRNQSEEIINENPFAIAERSGSLERIKNRMRDHIKNPNNSAKESFNIFWSSSYLRQNGYDQEMKWFERNIRPLVATNYYRSISENGKFTRTFWKVDLPFTIIFILEFLARTYLISRRYSKVTWFDAMLWRWYDVFLFLPIFRLLRIIPVTIRLNQVHFISLEPIRIQITRGFVAAIARELTEFVVVEVIQQIQGEIRRGDVFKQLFLNQDKPYLDINNVNEIEAIGNHLIQVVVYKVIPKLELDIEALLRYNIEQVIEQSPVIQQFKTIPGLQQIPQQIQERIITELSKLATEGPQEAYQTVAKAMNDPVGTKLSNQLVKNFNKLLGEELQKEQGLEEIKTLLIDFLEEFKINYIQQVDESNFEQVLAQLKEQRHIKGTE
ncbi:hypothetical protein [Planktothrix agardhii]|uniref:hypothetical protein n=1 Tax=Planktothrix agardhii TaxID=1160 RepID=UPI001D0B589E|nr:hypothetical protein [Planktothrix agardhii]MCB8750462.1 hypothetical protein [Planktothrix agardhii 1810]MCB8759220.1 hypothetical protein [Planktothrix agardhii 1813]MCB8787120.1 hypothetical protein [Planktothrix agardhii 1025]MCF3571679.1 hypothetical protein [Planktothrix agardhii 1805]MCF3574953.1 hypothetical protein [Planktothrix agardhii 1812]